MSRFLIDHVNQCRCSYFWLDGNMRSILMMMMADEFLILAIWRIFLIAFKIWTNSTGNPSFSVKFPKPSLPWPGQHSFTLIPWIIGPSAPLNILIWPDFWVTWSKTWQFLTPWDAETFPSTTVMAFDIDVVRDMWVGQGCQGWRTS